MMKQLKILFLLFTLFFCVSIFADTPMSAAGKLSELLNQFSTFQSNFMQKTVNLNQETLQYSSGIVMIERPGCFRWETLKPAHQIVITNGKKLWIYDVGLQQVTEQSIANNSMSPAKLLSGDADQLLQQFFVRMIPHGNILNFQLIPKKHNRQFKMIGLTFSHEKLISMQIENNMQQTTIFDFSRIVLNKRLSSSLFEFTAPRGVDVLQ